MAKAKTTLETQLKKNKVSLAKTKKKLQAFQQRNESVRDLRRQLNDALTQVKEMSTGNLRVENRWVAVHVFRCGFEKIWCIFALFLCVIRAEERAAAYRHMAQAKTTIETQLKQSKVSLAKTKKKLRAFQQRDESVRDLRRQLNDALTQVDEISAGNLRAEERWVLVM